ILSRHVLYSMTMGRGKIGSLMLTQPSQQKTKFLSFDLLPRHYKSYILEDGSVGVPKMVD
ncbi:MAG: hypothetical protein ACE5KE_07395, partial [Methanosarcinales archaeon]